VSVAAHSTATPAPGRSGARRGNKQQCRVVTNKFHGHVSAEKSRGQYTERRITACVRYFSACVCVCTSNARCDTSSAYRRHAPALLWQRDGRSINWHLQLAHWTDRITTVHRRYRRRRSVLIFRSLHHASLLLLLLLMLTMTTRKKKTERCRQPLQASRNNRNLRSSVSKDLFYLVLLCSLVFSVMYKIFYEVSSTERYYFVSLFSACHEMTIAVCFKLYR